MVWFFLLLLIVLRLWKINYVVVYDVIVYISQLILVAYRNSQ